MPNTIHEFPSSNGNTNLNVTYYVTLPEGIQRTDYRTTDYVIPGTTLASLLKDEQPVIEAQVRDSVSSSLTQKQSTDGETGRCWVLPVVVTSTVLVVVVCAFVAVVSTYTYKRTRRKSKKGYVMRILIFDLFELYICKQQEIPYYIINFPPTTLAY